MTKEEFLILLECARQELEKEAKDDGFKSSAAFENRVRQVVADIIAKQDYNSSVNFNSHVQAFPDICLDTFGIEVKFTEKDTWKGVANSINQGMKDHTVEDIYVMWCKAGGEPKVATRPYEDVVYHVRTSHVPRFEIDMETSDSLFGKFKLNYKEFSVLKEEQKMDFVRSYARNRLKSGIKQFYWYLESQVVDKDIKTTISLFDELPRSTQLKLIHEEILLVPQLILKSNNRILFDDRIRHFLNKHQVLYPHRYTLFNNTEGADFLKIEFDSELIKSISNSIDINAVRRFWTWDKNTNLSNHNLWEIWVKEVKNLNCNFELS